MMNKELKVVFLRSRRNGFGCDGHPALKCEPNGTIRANRFGKALTREKWNLYVIDDGEDNKKIALQSWTGKYLSAKPNGDVMADADAIGTGVDIEKRRERKSFYWASFSLWKVFDL